MAHPGYWKGLGTLGKVPEMLPDLSSQPCKCRNLEGGLSAGQPCQGKQILMLLVGLAGAMGQEQVLGGRDFLVNFYVQWGDPKISFQ